VSPWWQDVLAGVLGVLDLVFVTVGMIAILVLIFTRTGRPRRPR
jgi:hypothetical protein